VGLVLFVEEEYDPDVLNNGPDKEEYFFNDFVQQLKVQGGG
jgi:hypothetical protein